MFKLQIYEEHFTRLKKTYGRLFCNTVLMGDELKRLAASDKTNILVVHDAIYIVESETGFSRLYAVVPAENAECYFVEFQKLYAGRTTAFDLTGRLKSVKTMIDKLGSLGLKPYAEYDRYLLKRRKTPKGFFRSMCSGENITFDFAEMKDADEISDIFKEVMDKYTSHVPFSANEVGKRIENREICCAHYKNDLAAAFSFDIIDEKNIHLNVVASAREYDSLGLGMLLYEYVLDNFREDTKYICWIEKQNNASIMMHESFGFEKDEKMLFSFYVLNDRKGDNNSYNQKYSNSYRSS